MLACNGDTGAVTCIADRPENFVEIRLERSGNIIRYTKEELKTEYVLNLVYAMTIHKSQGSAYVYVIIPLVRNRYSHGITICFTLRYHVHGVALSTVVKVCGAVDAKAMRRELDNFTKVKARLEKLRFIMHICGAIKRTLLFKIRDKENEKEICLSGDNVQEVKLFQCLYLNIGKAELIETIVNRYTIKIGFLVTKYRIYNISFLHSNDRILNPKHLKT